MARLTLRASPTLTTRSRSARTRASLRSSVFGGTPKYRDEIGQVPTPALVDGSVQLQVDLVEAAEE